MHKEQWLTALVASLITLLALAPVGYALVKNMPPRIATVDLQKLVEEEQDRALAGIGKGGQEGSDPQRAAAELRMVEFAKRLSASVDSIGLECHCVLVNKAALLGGVTVDYTPMVRERLRP